MKKEVIVVGAGFRGLCACIRLLNLPNTVVHLIDPSPKFGGIMHSRKVDDFYIDFGVQMFDSIPKELSNIVTEIMDEKVEEIDFISESAFNGQVTEQFALPDLSSLDDNTKNKILHELIVLAANNEAPIKAFNLDELFLKKYGKTAGGIFSKLFEDIYMIPAVEVSSSAIDHTSLGRLKFLDDEQMRVLKCNPWLDGVLAARRKAMGKIDDYVSIYPTNGMGMKGFCERAVSWLTAKGVKLYLGEKIVSLKETPKNMTLITDKQTMTAHHVIWANDNIEQLAELSQFEHNGLALHHSSSLILMTLITEKEAIKKITYLQDFSPHTAVYRVASAGIYSKQVNKDGLSFVTCECPFAINSAEWINAEGLVDQIWSECQSLGVIHNSATRRGVDVLRAEKAQRFPFAGYESFLEELANHISRTFPAIRMCNMELFNRRQIYLDSEKFLNLYD